MWLKEAHVVSFPFTWKLTSHAMALKVSQIASWVHVHSLLWVQHKRWTLVASMGCVHTHWGIPTIEGCDNPSYIWNATKKDGKNNWKADQVVSQAPTLGLEHDKIQAQWVSNILPKSMLRDSNQFHHFEDDVCSCMDYWWCQ
jgi:hypothetical protein